jgi:hypothetical protein
MVSVLSRMQVDGTSAASAPGRQPSKMSRTASAPETIYEQPKRRIQSAGLDRRSGEKHTSGEALLSLIFALCFPCGPNPALQMNPH